MNGGIMPLLIATYDIADDKRRRNLFKLLRSYGDGVQESVFSCELREAQIAELKVKVRKLAKSAEDRVEFYTLCAKCVAKAEHLDGRGVELRPDVIVA